jgi:glycosyltransferase involved in cell wall biosynthesis
MCYGGSPTGVIPDDIYGRGIGGAELALLSLTETLADRGHEVFVYNDPRKRGKQNGVHFAPTSQFFPEHMNGYALDAFILFRTPWPGVQVLKCPKLFWSCDQATAGHFGNDIFPYVDRTVCISPYHREYFYNRYRHDPDRMIAIDLGVRVQDYAQNVQKVPGKCIYCSVPDRGLEVLHKAWPLIRKRVPHASLVITADYRLWGVSDPGDIHHRIMWEENEGVEYLGKIPRRELVQQQLESEVMAFPCTYEEMFCISSAECQVAGAVPVTSTMGALPTTIDVGITIPYAPHSPEFFDNFVGSVIYLLTSNALRTMGPRARKTQARFDWNRIAEQWEKLICTLG